MSKCMLHYIRIIIYIYELLCIKMIDLKSNIYVDKRKSYLLGSFQIFTVSPDKILYAYKVDAQSTLCTLYMKVVVHEGGST